MNGGVRGETMTVYISSVAPTCHEPRQIDVRIYVILSKGPGMNGHDPLHMAGIAGFRRCPRCSETSGTVDCGIRRVASEVVW